MTAHVLTNYMSLGEQTASDTFVDSTGNTPGVSGALSMEDAALMAVSGLGILSPEGEDFEIKVVYADQLNPLLQPVFEIMVASYELDNGVYKWVRQRTIASSNNGGAVTFQAASEQPNLKIFGVTTHENFNDIKRKDGDLRLLSIGQLSDSSDFTNTNTTVAGMSNSLIIPRNNVNSELAVSLGGDYRVRATSATANDLRGRLITQYKNSQEVWVDVGASQFIGYINVTPAGSSTLYAVPKLTTVLTGVHLNGDGNWEVRIAGEVDFADTELQSFLTTLNYVETA